MEGEVAGVGAVAGLILAHEVFLDFACSRTPIMDVPAAIIALLLQPDVSVAAGGGARSASPREVVAVASAAGIALRTKGRVQVIKAIIVGRVTD